MRILIRRDIVAEWWTKPWSELISAAESGIDGVEVSRGSYECDGLATDDNKRNGYACMRQGDAPHTAKAFLFRQNW